MKTIEIEIDGKMEKANVYESMWEYIEHYGSDISHYVCEPCTEKKDEFIAEFRPVDDSDFMVYEYHEIDGKMYQRVNWGESEITLIPESDLNVSFWIVYRRVDDMKFQCTSQIFQTREEAEREVA